MVYGSVRSKGEGIAGLDSNRGCVAGCRTSDVASQIIGGQCCWGNTSLGSKSKVSEAEACKLTCHRRVVVRVVANVIVCGL